MNNLNIENDYSTILDSVIDRTVQQKRPTFLTVLCVLSFVGNGLGVLQGIFIWGMSGVYATFFTSMAKTNQSINHSAASGIFNGIAWLALIFIVASIICIVGAFLMWKLKKSGFFIYIFGQIAPIVSILLFFASLDVPSSTMIGLVYAIILSLFPLAFIIMYAVNLKYLK